jgi:hypothetical protein
MATNPAGFASSMMSYAEQASAATGLDVGLIIAQWGNETAWGTEFAEPNNIGNIGVYSGGPNYSYPTLAAGVQAYINFMNGGYMAKYKAQWMGQSANEQAVIIGSSGYAGGGYNDGGGPGSSLIADMQEAGVGGEGVAPGLTAAQWQALYQAGQEGGTAYLEAAAAAAAQPSGGAAVATSSTMTAADWQAIYTASHEPGGAEYLAEMNAQAQVASQSTGSVAGSPTGTLADVVTSILQPYGLDTPTIQQWVVGQITNLAAQNMSTAQIGEQIGIELQAPVGSSSDPLTTAAQQAFSNLYPGMAIRKANGLPPITVAQYQGLQDSYYQAASAVGITPAMLNSIALPGGGAGDAVGQLIGNDVSATELTSRLQNGYNAAVNANPETMRLLQEYYPTVFPQGTAGQAPGTGALLAYYLNPKNTVTTLENQITAAQIGTEGVNSQFGGIPVAQAQKLQQAGVTQSTARTTFNSLAKLTPFENTLPGTQSPNAMMTQSQLIDYGFFGANQQLLENVESNRKAPFSGGGGYAATAKGIVGAGGASTEGVEGT